MTGESLPLGALTPMASLPPPKCKYQQFHIDDVETGSNVTGTDGLTFSPDGTKIAFPLLVNWPRAWIRPWPTSLLLPSSTAFAS